MEQEVGLGEAWPRGKDEPGSNIASPDDGYHFENEMVEEMNKDGSFIKVGGLEVEEIDG